jgi:hypothetical protein
LDPLKSGFQGSTVVASLGSEGLTVNWTVSANAAAIATAIPGTGFALGSGTVLLGLAGIGGILGIVAGTGGFDSGGGDNNVVSDSQ